MSPLSTLFYLNCHSVCAGVCIFFIPKHPQSTQSKSLTGDTSNTAVKTEDVPRERRLSTSPLSLSPPAPPGHEDKGEFVTTSHAWSSSCWLIAPHRPPHPCLPYLSCQRKTKAKEDNVPETLLTDLRPMMIMIIMNDNKLSILITILNAAPAHFPVRGVPRP